MARKRASTAAANQVSGRYAEWLSLHQEQPPILYHYTTADGLFSMLQSGHIWATDSRYMNDPTELRYATSLLREVMAEELKGKKGSEVADWLKWMLDEQDAEARVYLASFCADGDLLSQWRAYGAFGGGYAMGFDPGCLYGRQKYEKRPYRILRKVIYDAELQRLIIRSWLTDLMRQQTVQQWNALTRDFLKFLSECLSTFKDPGYREEAEWRLIQFGRDETRTWAWPMKFRARAGQIVPYADLDLSKSKGQYNGRLPLRVIVHGPTLNPERAMRSLQLFCASRGFNADILDLRASKIPFVG
ncbi:MAG TPA: DUF2971 domain-containing protein [Blastocatellia bacterium]|nr:DUF2971 domain-containing protein [Blastocatellia bacterium]